jgi:hypothetical protein
MTRPLRTPAYLLDRQTALARMVADKVEADPERAVAVVAANLNRWLDVVDPRSRPLLDPWIAISDDSQAMVRQLRASGERADLLRSVAPLAGILSQEERLAFLTSYDVTYAA